MGWIALATAIIGAVALYQEFNATPESFGSDELDVIDAAIEDAEESANLAAAKAKVDLDQFMGQLAEEFATYDEWYTEQVNEWNDTDGAMSLEDYIRSQQTSELGELGVERARLESQVAIAEERLGAARLNVAKQQEFAGQQYDAGVTQSQRTTRAESAAVAAMGIRGGTIQATVAENQRVRMEALDLYLSRMDWAADVSTMEIDTAATEIERAEELGLASLSQSITSARTNFDFSLERIDLDLTQYTDTLRLRHELNFGWDDWNRQALGGALDFATGVFGIFAAGIGAGLWGTGAGSTPTPVGGGGGVPQLFTP